MKKTLVTAAVLVAGLALTGCAAESEPAPTVTVTAAPATPSPTAKQWPTAAPTLAGIGDAPQENRFFAALDTSDENFSQSDYEGILTIGEGLCEMYDNGATSSDINNLLMTGKGYAYTLKQLVSIHGYAVGALCPEHLDKLS